MKSPSSTKRLHGHASQEIRSSFKFSMPNPAMSKTREISCQKGLKVVDFAADWDQ
jgi:hypothetical protein